MASSPKVAQNACASEPPPSGSGLAATRMPAAPPATRMSRPAVAADRRARPVMTSQPPTAASTAVITHRSVAPSAASELTVLVIASKELGCRAAATVHPPISSAGAIAADSTPHHATPRTTLAIGQPRTPLTVGQGREYCPVPAPDRGSRAAGARGLTLAPRVIPWMMPLAFSST